MFNEINNELKEYKKELILKETLERKLQSLREVLIVKEKEFATLKLNLEKEHRDVEKLEHISFKNVMATILRNKEERLYKEEQEYIQAKLRYDECLSIISSYKNDIESLRERISNINNVQANYEKLINKKSEMLKEINDCYREQIVAIENLLDIELQEKIDIQEAISEANKCINVILDARRALESAKSWGTYDLFGGGGLSSIIKHSEVSDAKKKLESLEYALGKLNKELSDVSMSLAVESLSSIESSYVFDVFFDNIFTDMNVQDKIKDSLRNVIEIEDNVRDALTQLYSKRDNNKVEIDKSKRKYEELIENIE